MELRHLRGTFDACRYVALARRTGPPNRPRIVLLAEGKRRSCPGEQPGQRIGAIVIPVARQAWISLSRTDNKWDGLSNLPGLPGRIPRPSIHQVAASVEKVASRVRPHN
jgi:hypothetical protein